MGLRVEVRMWVREEAKVEGRVEEGWCGCFTGRHYERSREAREYRSSVIILGVPAGLGGFWVTGMVEPGQAGLSCHSACDSQRTACRSRFSPSARLVLERPFHSLAPPHSA